MTTLDEAYKSAKKKIVEDAVMGAGEAAGPVGDVSAPPSGPAPDADIVKPGGAISHDDVLGHHVPGKGFLGKKDFYIPKNILGKGNVMHRRWQEIDGTKRRKGHPNDSAYLKGMTTIKDAEDDPYLNSDNVKGNKYLALDKVSEELVIDYVLKTFNLNAENYLETSQIVLIPKTDKLWIKFKTHVNTTPYPVYRFVEAHFDTETKKFTPTENKKMMTTQEAKKTYAKICKENGLNPHQTQLYVIDGISGKALDRDRLI